MSKVKYVHIRDNKVSGFYAQIDALIGAGHDATDRQEWAEGLQHYDQARETVQQALKYCQKKKKIYIRELESFLPGLEIDKACCLRHLGRIDECLECYESAYRGGRTEVLDDMLATAHNANRYQQALRYMLINNKYKSLPLKTLYNYAVRLSTPNMGLQEDINQSLVFFLFLHERLQEAMVEVEPLKEEGYSEENIAELYGKLQNTAKELEWRRKAVQKKNPLALHNYGEMFNDGQGVKKDESEALKYHLLAAESGHLPAMIACGIHFSQSEEIPLDYEMAEYWFSRALEKEASSQAANFYCCLIINCQLKNLDNYRPKLAELIGIVEQDDPDAAICLRALLLAHDPKADRNQIMQAAEILQELVDKGHSSATANLAVIYQRYPYFSRTLAVPLYLEALSNGEFFVRGKLFVLMLELAVELGNSTDRLLQLFRMVEKRYRDALPPSQRHTDDILPLLTELRKSLEQGIKGNVTEYFKLFFPKTHDAINSKIISMSANITATARTQSSSVSERIATILEISLSCDSTNRGRTCAFRRIGEIAGGSPRGFEALMEHRENFNQLSAQIVAGDLDNEGYIELAVGLAKLKIHPQSQLVWRCYQKLHQYHGENFRPENLLLTPYQFALLISALSDMPVSDQAFLVSLAIPLIVVQESIPRMNGWQLLKTFQAICVIQAYHASAHKVQGFIPKIVEKLLESVVVLNPNELSMIDCYQLYLCLNYVDKKNLASTATVRGQFRDRFLGLTRWMRNQATTASQSQLRLVGFLRRYRSDVVTEKYMNGLFVDIWLKNVNVVMEFDGPAPFHFMWTLPDDDLPLTQVTRDCFHEVIVGVQVIRVNYRELDSVDQNDPQQVKAFLQKKLAAAGVVLSEPAAVEQLSQDEVPQKGSAPK